MKALPFVTSVGLGVQWEKHLYDFTHSGRKITERVSKKQAGKNEDVLYLTVWCCPRGRHLGRRRTVSRAGPAAFPPGAAVGPLGEAGGPRLARRPWQAPQPRAAPRPPHPGPQCRLMNERVKCRSRPGARVAGQGRCRRGHNTLRPGASLTEVQTPFRTQAQTTCPKICQPWGSLSDPLSCQWVEKGPVGTELMLVHAGFWSCAAVGEGRRPEFGAEVRTATPFQSCAYGPARAHTELSVQDPNLSTKVPGH